MARDGEAFEFYGDVHEMDSEDEDEDEDDSSVQKNQDNAGMDDSGRLRLRADVSLDDGNYAGKRSSRKVAFEEEDPEDEDAGASELLRERLLADHGDASSDEDRETAIAGQLSGARDDELEALSREYERLREEEKAPEILRGQEEDDRRKGQAVRHQRALWDRILEFRILLQKNLAAANRLPRERGRAALCDDNDQIRAAYGQLTDSAVRALNCLVDLEAVLVENNSDITERYSRTPNGKRKREAVEDVEGAATGSKRAWEKLDEMNSRLVPYRDNALNRWQTKTQIFTGAVAKVKFQAFNQSLSQQVASTMRDSSRLIARTKMKSDSVDVIGHAAKKPTTISSPILEVAGTGPLEGLDLETYDDSDFYQQLLREFLESSDPSALSSMYATARQHNKKRKQVDRRASKGRKLRYNVFEPLVNFMAPRPVVDHSMAAQLFANLFGLRGRAPIPAV